MAEQVQAQGFDPINYGAGTGWLDYYNLLSQMLTQQGASQAATGSSVLGQLTNFLTSPTSGPLGLAATAAYGNPQGIAAATQGKGFDNSAYQSRFEKVLDDLLGYTGNINKQASDIPVVDPNKAPAPTPENAAKAPNVAQDWIRAWEAYNPGQQHPQRKEFGLAMGGILSRMFGGKVPGAQEGLKIPGAPEMPGAPDNPLAGLTGLAEGAEKWVGAGGKANDYWATIQQIGRLAQNVEKAFQSDLYRGDNEEFMLKSKQIAPADPRNMRVSEPVRQVGTSLGLKEGTPEFEYLWKVLANADWGGVSGQYQSDPTALARDLLMKFRPQADASGLWLPRPQGFADGGVTLAGQPHWIVDDNGYPVAAITEDGAPENVRGLKNGGVEVTPLRPDRFEKYTGQEPSESDMWGRMLARMEVAPRMPGAATGQKLMFPDYAGGSAPGGVDTDPGPGSNMIPTWGGPTAPRDRGVSYGTDAAPKTIDDLFKSVAGAPGANSFEQYARLLGGALASNTTMGDAASALNAGRAPTQLPSKQQLSTMSPSQRAGYMAMLQQMGIIQSPEDFAHYVGQFTPAGLKKGGKLPPPGEGGRFAALSGKLAKREGVRDPDALAASIGRKKYGKGRMAKMAAAGRK